MISLNLDLSNIDQINIDHTLLESTSLLFAHGQDIFFKKFSPENVISLYRPLTN